MKGKLAIGTVVALVIVVIVVAIAIYFLVFVNPFDPYFLDPAKYKLIRYATCSLALCANGVSSDGAASKQIDNVGCLEYEGGRCVKTCNDIKNDFVTNSHEFEEDSPFGIPLVKERHYCNENNAIEFEIEPSFPLNIRGEEIQKLSKPKWICRGLSFLGVRFDLTDEFESSFGECIMYGSLFGEGILLPPGKKENFEEAEGLLCFQSIGSWQFQKVVFTPLIPYSEIAKIGAIDSVAAHYPSALYIKDQFATGSNPECEISNNGPVLVKDGKKTEINTISQCKIKTVDEKGRRVFKVWSEGRRAIPLERGVIGGNGENCASVILDTGVANYPFTPGKTLSSSREQIFPALVAANGKLYLFFQDADSVNQQRGVFTASGSDSTIVYATSSDGSFASFQGTPIPNLFPYEAKATVLQPSATLLNGHKYLAYSTNLGKGETYDIMVKDLDGGANLKGGQPERATDDQVSQFNPSITAFDGKLYLFYEQDLPNLPSEIYYKVGTVTGDRVKWSEASLFASGWKNPSAAPTSDGLMITYSFDCGANSPLNSKPSFGGKPRFGQAGKSTESATACENGVGAAIFKDDNFQDAGIVESGSETYGVSKPIAIGNDVFVFFDKGGESKRIFYSKYLGEGKWQESSPAVPYSSKSQVMPSLAEFGGGLVLAFSELGDNYDIRVSSLKGDLAGSSTPVAVSAPQSEKEIAKSLTISTVKDSYKQGETVKFSGQLTGAKKDDEVKLELRANVEEGAVPLFIPIENVKVDEEGKFAWEFKLNPELTERNYEIVATFGGLEAKHRFTVGVESIPTSKADLKVQELMWNSKEKILQFTVENSGQIGIDLTTFLVEIKIDPEIGETQSVARTPLDTETPEQLRIYGPRSTFSSLVPQSLLGILGGRTKFTIIIDPRNTIKEFDEENNVKEIVVDFPKPTGGCVSLVENGLPTDKLDVVLLPDRYSDKAKFVEDAKKAVDSFKNKEPFKSNFKKMNFHYVDADNLDLEAPDSKINFNVDVKKALLYSLNCPGYDEKIVLTDRKGRSAAGGFSSHINQVYVRGLPGKEPLGPFTVLHEFGHSFGGLQDEYLESSGVVSGSAAAEVVLTGTLASYLLKPPNCDVEGCPKWCSGGLGSEFAKLLNKCSAAKTLGECQTARSGEQPDCLFIPAINDKTKEITQTPTGQLVSCRQLAFKTPAEISALVASDPWYKENCFACSVNIKKFQKSDFGLSCQLKSGCFLGCGIIGANLWRPSYNSIMNDHYVSGGQEFNEPSKRELRSLLDKFK